MSWVTMSIKMSLNSNVWISDISNLKVHFLKQNWLYLIVFVPINTAYTNFCRYISSKRFSYVTGRISSNVLLIWVNTFITTLKSERFFWWPYVWSHDFFILKWLFTRTQNQELETRDLRRLTSSYLFAWFESLGHAKL